MSLAKTRLQVHNAIVTRLSVLFDSAQTPGKPTRPIYNRTRRPPQNTEGQIAAIFLDENGVLSFIVVRYVGLLREAAGYPSLETSALIYAFEIEVRRAVNESDDDVTASEVLFNADLDAIAGNLQDTDLGLGVGVSTPGFIISQPIPRYGEEFYSKLTHVARGALVVTVGEC